MNPLKAITTKPYRDIAWLLHRDKHRVPKNLIIQYRTVFDASLERLGKPPAVFDGGDYNNKIKWLMLFDQRPEIVQLSDKLAVRDYVAKNAGPQYLAQIFAIWEHPGEVKIGDLPDQFVLKTNHDSGSVWPVKDRRALDWDRLCKDLRQSIQKTDYGKDKGEWCYQHIPPKLFAEEYLEVNSPEMPDFKFHCCLGEVRFVQYIYNRNGKVPKEIILAEDGKALDILLDDHFEQGCGINLPSTWNDMIHVAQNLSKPFKYVRVDLYSTSTGVKFGELTFYPRNGNYRGCGQKKIGGFIDIDRSTTLPPYQC